MGKYRTFIFLMVQITIFSRYHYQVWKEWQLRNYVVTVLPMPPRPIQREQEEPAAETVAALLVSPRPFNRHRKSNSESIQRSVFDSAFDDVTPPLTKSSTPRIGSTARIPGVHGHGSGTRSNNNPLESESPPHQDSCTSTSSEMSNTSSASGDSSNASDDGKPETNASLHHLPILAATDTPGAPDAK
jgi:hypothetical protein